MQWIARSVGLLPKLIAACWGSGRGGDGLNGILFEFLDDDTKLAQSCSNWFYVHWYVVAPDHVESCKKKTYSTCPSSCVSCPASQTRVCFPVYPAQAFQSVKKKSFFFGRGRREGRWPEMVSTQGDFCAHAWTRARRATDRDLESVSASFCVNAWLCAARSTDHDPANIIFNKIRNVCNLMQTYCFRFNFIFVIRIILSKMVWENSRKERLSSGPEFEKEMHQERIHRDP